jgi:hypothetical protein
MVPNFVVYVLIVGRVAILLNGSVLFDPKPHTLPVVGACSLCMYPVITPALQFAQLTCQCEFSPAVHVPQFSIVIPGN